MIDLLVALLISGLAAGAILAWLYWDNIYNWFYENKTSYDDYGELVKRELENGNVRVVTGVFNRYGTQKAIKIWEAENVDYELERKFGYSDRIRISL